MDVAGCVDIPDLAAAMCSDKESSAGQKPDAAHFLQGCVCRELSEARGKSFTPFVALHGARSLLSNV